MEDYANEAIATLTIDERIINLNVGYYLIGRLQSELKQDIQIDDETLDVKHAALCVTELGGKLLDLYSSKGTFVDEKKLERMEIVELPKSTKIQFGNVVCYFQTIHESDSGFMPHSPVDPKDISEIVPGSPSVKSYWRRANLANDKSPTQGISDNEIDSFCIPSTQAIAGNTNNKSVSFNENLNTTIPDDDDFYVPETQEISSRPDLNDNEKEMCHILTQDYLNCNEDSNSSENICANVEHLLQPESMLIPYIAADGKETDNQQKFESLDERELRDDEDTDCEEEISALKGQDCTRREASITPDLELKEIKNEEDDLMEPTQIFKVADDTAMPVIVSAFSLEDQNLEDTQFFELKEYSPSKKRINQETDNLFKKPQSRLHIEDDAIEATQPFNRDQPSTSGVSNKIGDPNNFDDDDFLQPTQMFRSQNNRTISPVILESDEENDEYCLRDTLVVGENPQISTVSKNESKKLPTNKTKSKHNKLFEDSEEGSSESAKTPVQNSNLDILTPNLGSFALPTVDQIKKAGIIYLRKTSIQNRMSNTSDEDVTDTDEKVFRILNGGTKKKIGRPKRLSTYRERPILNETESESNVNKPSDNDSNVTPDKEPKSTRSGNKLSTKQTKEKKAEKTKKSVQRKSQSKNTKYDTLDIANVPSTSKDVVEQPPNKRAKSSRKNSKGTELEGKQKPNSSGELCRLRRCNVLLEKMDFKNFSESKKSTKDASNKRRRSIADDNIKPKKKSKENQKPEKKNDSRRRNDSSATENSDGYIRKSLRPPKTRVAFTKIDTSPYIDIVEKIATRNTRLRKTHR